MTTPAATTEKKPLSANEEARFKQLEIIIRENFASFVRVGQSLAEIRDRQLYRATHRTFEKYCKYIFDMSSRRAQQLIDAAEVVKNVNNCSQIGWEPANEAQARPLAKIIKSNPATLQEVLEMAVETARDGRITASHMDRVVKRFIGENVTHTVRKASSSLHGPVVGAEFKEAFDAFMAQIVKARESGYRQTSRLLVIAALEDALQAIKLDPEYNDEVRAA